MADRTRTTRTILALLAACYLLVGAFELFAFRFVGERTAVAGVSAILAAIVAAVIAVRVPYKAPAIITITIILSLAIFVWSCLSWSAGHDGPAFFWVYVMGPLNAAPLIFIPMVAVANKRSPRTNAAV